MWVYDVETLAFLAVNDAAVVAYGYSEEEFLGLTLKDIRPVEDLPALLDDVAAASGLSGPTDWRHVTKAGEVLDVKVTAHDLAFGGRAARLVMALDVTEQRRAEEATMASERRWRQLVANSSDAISILGPDGTVLFSSSVIERLFGRSFDGNVGSNMLDSVHPDDVEIAIEAFSQILDRKGPSDPVEIRIRQGDGTIAWVEAVTNNLLDDPDVAGIVVNTRGITDRKLAEEEQQRSEARWRRLFENSSDVVSVIGRDGEVIASTTGSRFFDRALDPTAGASFVDYLHPDDLAKAAAMFDKMLTTPGASEPLEVRVRDADGGWHWIESIANNLLDDPVVAGIVVNTRDIDERRRAEDALRESEERFRFIVQHTTDIISVINHDGTVRYTSPAAASLPGYPLPGDSFVDGLRRLVGADSTAALARLDDQLATPGVHEPIHLQLIADDGTREMELTVNNLVEDSPVAGILVVTRDITERERQKRRRIMDELFADLVVGTVDSAHLARAHAAGLVQASAYRAVVVPLEPAAGESDGVRLALGDEIEGMHAPGSLSGTFGGLGGLILPADVDGVDLARRLEAALASAANEPVLVALGGLKDGPNALKLALDDAMRVLGLARRRGLSGLVTGDEVVVPALLASAPEIADELSHMLQPLIAEDQRGRGELVETLRTYLAVGLSVHRTSEGLVVHRNTVRSRLKRIETLLGGDIGDLKLPLELALLAHDLASGAAPG